MGLISAPGSLQCGRACVSLGKSARESSGGHLMQPHTWFPAQAADSGQWSCVWGASASR